MATKRFAPLNSLCTLLCPGLPCARHAQEQTIVLAMIIASVLSTSAFGFQTSTAAGKASDPKITRISPTFGSGGTYVTIAGSKLGLIDKIFFGGTAAGFQVHAQPNGTIVVPAPYLSPGSTVPVTALYRGEIMESTAKFSYTIGEMDIEGPTQWDGEDRDSAWFNGRHHSLTSHPPKALQFTGTPPVFHIITAFTNNADTPIYPPSPVPHNVGNKGKYSAILRMCSVDATPTHAPGERSCTNWDGNSGIWVEVDGGSQMMTLDRPGPIGEYHTAEGGLALPTASAFDETHLVRTFQLDMTLQQQDTNTAEAEVRRTDSLTTEPFDVVLIPTALIQMKDVPYTIIYHPPGNLSTSNFSTQATYGTNFKLGNTKDISNSYKDTSSNQTKVSEGVGYSLGSENGRGIAASVNFGGGDSWDKTTTESFGTTHDSQDSGGTSLAFTSTFQTAANPALVPNKGDTCASSTDCSPSTLKHHSSQPANLDGKGGSGYFIEPFWDDLFVLLIHPQFGYWVLGDGEDRFVMLRAVQAVGEIHVSDLAACANHQTVLGQDRCVVTYSDSDIKTADGKELTYQGASREITLSAADATELLKLDPFYGSGQSAQIATRRGLLIARPSYGAKVHETPPGPFATSYNNTMMTGTGKTETVTTVSSVEDVIGSDWSVGETLAYIGSEGVTVTNSEKKTSNTTIKTVLSDSTAIQNQVVTSVTVSLNDVDNTTISPGGVACKICHDPLPDIPRVNVYLDRIFGSFMYQEPDAPSGNRFAIKPQQIANTALTAMMQREQSYRRYSDVPDDSPAKVAIGLLSETRIMPGYPNGKFQPNDPLTRQQLATIISKAVRLPTPPPYKNTFADISHNEAVAAPALATVRAGLIRPKSNTIFGATDTVSRQELATALDGAFKTTLMRPSPSTKSVALGFADSKDIAPWAESSVRAVVAAGYMPPYSEKMFKPTAAVTRAEAAQALVAALKDQQEKGGER